MTCVTLVVQLVSRRTCLTIVGCMKAHSPATSSIGRTRSGLNAISVTTSPSWVISHVVIQKRKSVCGGVSRLAQRCFEQWMKGERTSDRGEVGPEN